MPRLFDTAHLVALTVTLLSEGGGMALLAARIRFERRYVLQCVAVAVAVNLVSHTAFWVGFPMIPWGGANRLLAVESVIVLVEAVPYWLACRFGWGGALLASAILNLASFVLGVTVWRLVR